MDSLFDTLRDFWQGLTGRTTASWVGAVAVCVGELCFCAAYFKPQTFARIDPHYLMLDKGDEYLLLTARLASLRYRPSQRVEVLYLGTSCATRALTTREPAKVAAEISAAAGRKVGFLPFSTNGQRMEESLIITDQLPESFRGVVVFVVSDYLDDYAQPKKLALAHTRIAVASAPSILPIWRAEGYTPRHTGNFFIDHLDFFAARRAVALRPTRAQGMPGQGAFNLDKLDEGIERFERERAQRDGGRNEGPQGLLSGSAPLLTKSRGVVVKLLSNTSARGVPLVFVRAPDLPSRTAAHPGRSERFDRELGDLAMSYGAVVWDYNPELDLEDADFQDAIHLGSPGGRRRFEDLLVRDLGELIRDRFDNRDASAGHAPARPPAATEPEPEAP